MFMLRVMNKSGQQSSFGMSFGVIFSIFLIIVFISIAIVAINAFLDFKCKAQLGNVYENLQSRVNSVWRGSGSEREFDIKFCGGVRKVCFANLSAEITGDDSVYKEIAHHEYNGYNTFMMPPGKAGDLDVKNIEHLDIAKITAESNPYCITEGSYTVSKGVRSRLVMVQ